jgi:IS30 family transposase
MEQNNNNSKGNKWQQLTEKDRYKIEVLVAQGLNPEQIGLSLTPIRSRRTIERELAKGMTLQRNSDLTEKSIYLADAAQRITEERAANKGRGLKIGHDHKLAKHIEQKIGDEGWSPDAVIGEIKAQGLEFETTICTKTVYNMIDRGDFLNITNKDLPIKKDGKKRKYNKVRKVALNNTKGRSIEERPIEIEAREEQGHWEMDCVVGKQGTTAALLVLTERTSRKELIFKLQSKSQENVINIINELENEYQGDFRNIFKSITMDNGSEFLDMKSLEKSCLNTDSDRTVCYYAHPFSSWERGSNENANKIIRRFIPKGTDIAQYSEEDIKRIENWMNNYPRKILGYKTANQVA